MKPTKKKTAKKRNPMVGKLLDLKYRINDAFKNRKLHKTLIGDTRIDKQWLMSLISDVRGNDLVKISKEDKKKMWIWMRENMKISSEDDSVTVDSEDGKKQIGRQNYRSAGAGVQKVTGNFGKDIQKCAKSKLAASGQV